MNLLATLWLGLCLGLLIGSAVLAWLQPALALRRRTAAAPAVSMLIPVRGAAPGFTEASLSALAQGHRPLEVVFSAARDDETGAAAIRAVLATAPPGVAMRLVRTAPAVGINPKIANLIEPCAVAAHDLILIKDATTRLAPDKVDAMARMLVPGIGLVCAAPIGRNPQGFVAAVEAAQINSFGARLLLAGAALGFGAGIGAAMMFRRADLERIGGLSAVATAIADDHAISKALAGTGLATTFTASTVDQSLGRREAAAVWRRHLRWALCRRTAEPLVFWLEPFIGLAAACLAAALATASPLPVLAMPVLWVLVEGCLAGIKGWPLGLMTAPAIMIREALAPLLWLTAALTRRIAWGQTLVAVVPPGGGSR